jgi:predicted pyridoxine 5'-phosphate oxidase superfamily flavin-nucleotide-binding protein
MTMFHSGSREMQDRFDSRRIADRLETVTVQEALDESDRAFIEGCSMFFLATADADGRPDCSYKGGLPGFVRVLDEGTLAFPDYDGNGMFRSMGNLLVNPHVGLLFIDFEEPKRLRVNGTAEVSGDHPLLEDFPGARQMVVVRVDRAFPNCPRYIHRMRPEEHSVYSPRRDYTPPVPGWKQMEAFRDALPRDQEE